MRLEKEPSVALDPHEILAESLMDHLGIPKNMSCNNILATHEKEEAGHRLNRLLDVVSDGALVPLMHFTLSRSHVEKIAELKGLQTSMGLNDTRNNLGNLLKALAGKDHDQLLNITVNNDDVKKLCGFNGRELEAATSSNNPEETGVSDEETDVDEALTAADNDIPKWRLEQEGQSELDGIISDEDDSLPEKTRDIPQKLVKMNGGPSSINFEVKEESSVEEPTMSKKTVRQHTMTAHLFKHILEDVEVLVNPDTLEVMGETSQRLRELLSVTPMKELIDLGMFTFDVAVDIIVKSEIVEDHDDRDAERREDCAKAAERRQLRQLARGTVFKF